MAPLPYRRGSAIPLAAGPSWVEADIPDPFVLVEGIAVDIELADMGTDRRVEAVVVGHTEAVRTLPGRVAVVEDIAQEVGYSQYWQVAPWVWMLLVECHNWHRSVRRGRSGFHRQYNKCLPELLARACYVRNWCRRHY